MREQLTRDELGDSYAAVHPTTGEKVSIRVIDPRLTEDTAIVERFARHARRCCRAAPEQVMTLHGEGRLEDGRLYAVYDFSAGGRLADLLETHRLTQDAAVSLVETIATAVDTLHQEGLGHGWLSPERVVVEPQPDNSWPPIVRLADVGVALLLRPSEAPAIRSDIHALSLIAARLLPLTSPIRCDNIAQLCEMLQGLRGHRPRAESAAVVAAVTQSAAPEPAETAGDPVVPDPSAPSPPRQATRPRLGWSWALLWLLLVTAACTGLYLLAARV